MSMAITFTIERSTRRDRGIGDRRDLPAAALTHERELIDAVRKRAAVADDLEIGPQIRQRTAVDRDRDVRERLAELREVGVAPQAGEPLVAGLERVAPLSVALARDDHDRFRGEIGRDLVPVPV